MAVDSWAPPANPDVECCFVRARRPRANAGLGLTAPLTEAAPLGRPVAAAGLVVHIRKHRVTVFE